jgi:hypothetical protein
MTDVAVHLPQITTILITLGGLFLLGLELLSQAGVAIGMALLASQRFPELRDIILPVVLGSTVVFELIGLVFTRGVLIRVGDVKHD